MENKLFTTEYTREAIEQLQELAENDQDKILAAIGAFEIIGTRYKNINKLKYDLYEIKPSGVRAYFKYDQTQRKIIIVGFICLKKSQKAPEQYMLKAVNNIEKYLKERDSNNDKKNHNKR